MSEKVNFKAVDYNKEPKTVTIDGHNVYVAHYECRDANMYFKYKSVDRSFEMCLQSIGYIQKKINIKCAENDINIDAHHTSLIVHYARCFVSGGVKLERKLIPKKYMKSHDQVMRLRHEYIAHLGGDGEGSVNYVALNPNLNEKKIIRVIPPIPLRIRYVNDAFLSDLFNIIVGLRKFIKKKAQLHFDRLCKEINDIDIEQVYKGFEDFDLEGSEHSVIIPNKKTNYKISASSDGKVYISGTTENS